MTPPAVVLVVAVVAFAGAVWLLVSVVSGSRTNGLLLVAVALGLAAFVAGAWAAGRIRGIRGMTPEAIIRSGRDDTSPQP